MDKIKGKEQISKTISTLHEVKNISQSDYGLKKILSEQKSIEEIKGNMTPEDPNWEQQEWQNLYGSCVREQSGALYIELYLKQIKEYTLNLYEDNKEDYNNYVKIMADINKLESQLDPKLYQEAYKSIQEEAMTGDYMHIWVDIKKYNAYRLKQLSLLEKLKERQEAKEAFIKGLTEPHPWVCEQFRLSLELGNLKAIFDRYDQEQKNIEASLEELRKLDHEFPKFYEYYCSKAYDIKNLRSKRVIVQTVQSTIESTKECNLYLGRLKSKLNPESSKEYENWKVTSPPPMSDWSYHCRIKLNSLIKSQEDKARSSGPTT